MINFSTQMRNSKDLDRLSCANLMKGSKGISSRKDEEYCSFGFTISFVIFINYSSRFSYSFILQVMIFLLR